MHVVPECLPRPNRLNAAGPHTLHVENADVGLGLVLQAGAVMDCTTGIPLMNLLHDELGLGPEQTKDLDVFLLNGKPVDTPLTTIVPHKARLALAAGLPGIAGLAMRSDSAVKGMRPGITHGAGQISPDKPDPMPGEVELVLYSLALKRLGTHFLRRSFTTTAGKLLTHAQPSLQGHSTFDGQPMDGPALLAALAALPSECPVRLSAAFPA